jgi:hypothetical protein
MGFHSPQSAGGWLNIRTIQELLGHKEVVTTMIYAYVLNPGGKSIRSPTHSEPRRFGFRVYTDPHETEGPSPASDNLLITRDLRERSARFYTEENLGRRVYAERDIHC